MRARGMLVGFALLALGALAAPAASAAPANIIAGNGIFDQYNPTTYSHDGGTIATMTWAGGSGSHDVTASSPGPGGGPLFSSATISSGTTPVNGTQFAPAGSYGFFCTVHGQSMSGTLNVTGTPLARPGVALSIKTSSLAQALKRSAVKVKVTITGGGEAQVGLKLGKKKIGVTKSTSKSGVLKIPLTKKGEAVLEGKQKATVKATATIEFGEPDTAKRKLT